MKKVILLVAFFATSLLNAQDNWDSVIVDGSGSNYNYTVFKKFQNKLYLGANNPGLEVFGSATGNMGSYAPITGVSAATQGGQETHFVSATNNAAYLFFGSGIGTYTTGTATPQVYRYDGSNFVKHGTINYTSLPPDDTIPQNSSPEFSAMALYSPTGSNDSIYAFLKPDIGSHVSVWKASASATNPTWINSTNFPLSSGITKVYDAITWHKKLYIAVNHADSMFATNPYPTCYILSTSNGVTWDTVATSNSFIKASGYTPSTFSTPLFKAFEIHNDTLVVGMDGSSGASLWATTDSLATFPAWTCIYNNNDQQFYGIVDLQSDGKNIWIECNDNSGYVSMYRYSHILASYGFLPGSFGGTDLGSYNAIAYGYHMAYFGNVMYTAGYITTPQSIYTTGNVWRLYYPVANFNFYTQKACVKTVDSLLNTSQHYTNSKWYIDGVFYSMANDTVFSFPAAGTHTISIHSRNGSGGGLEDSLSKVITVYSNPVIDSVTVALDSICQGQPDTARAYMATGSGPYVYGWTNSLNIIGLNDSIIPFTFTNVTPVSPSPIGFFVMDNNGCQTTWPGTLTVFVNGSDSLSGSVIDTLLNPVMAGKVYLFRLNPLNPQPGDTMSVFTLGAGGGYYFPSLYYGNYITKVEADTSNALYKTAVGTYYSNKTYPFQWDSALVIQHHSCVNGNIGGNDIKILQMPGVGAGGPGTISGDVSKDSSYTGARYGNGGFVPMGAPLKGVDVKLGKNPGGSPAARTTTDTSGHYTFTNVPIGNYKIYIDIPNYGMDSVRLVSLTPTNTVSIHNDYYVDSTMIRVVPVDTVIAAICAGDSVLLQ